MVARTMALTSERWLDEVTFTPNAAPTNVGADTNDTYALPPGFGDCAIMELQIVATGVATMLVDDVLKNTGIYAFIQSAAGNNLDFVGTAKWVRVAADRVAVLMSPDPLVLWQQNELLNLVYPELDTNVAPADDHAVIVKAVRVCPQAGAPAPIKLVR